MKQEVVLPPPPDPDPYRDPIALAVVAEVVERGPRASVSGLIARGGVSQDDFERRYATLEDCAVDSFERFSAAFERQVGSAFNAQAGWRSSLRMAAYATADFIEESPLVVRFGLTGVLGMKSEIARVRREEVIVFCGDLVDLGRHEAGAEVGEDKATATFAIGSIVQLLTHRLQSGGPVEPHAIVPEMMYRVVSAYLGEEAAREELDIPRPDSG